MEEIKNYDYPRQFILNEKEGTRIYKKLGVDESSLYVDDYQWQIVSTITDMNVEGEIYSLIQHEDSKLGWIKFNNSIQIFRFEPEITRFIDDEFEANFINEKLNINKDFRTHFTGKLLSVKSEITYDGNQLVGVFVEDKFFGFHDERHFENLMDCNIKLQEEIIAQKVLFKTSRMHDPVSEEINLNNPILISIFKNSNIGKIKVNNKEYFWIYLDGLEKLKENIETITKNKNEEQRHIDDLFYAVKKERRQSKEIVKTVLSLKEYIQTKNSEDYLDYDIASNNELRKELKTMKKQIDKLTKELKLSDNRLEHHKNYNKRLEYQKDKYKSRMNFLEEKFKVIKDKSK